MATLKKIDLPEKAPKKSAAAITEILVDGDAIRLYNEAADAAKAAIKVMEEIKPKLVEIGVEEVFRLNCKHGDQPDTLISTVNLKDDATGEICQCTWSKKQLKLDEKAIKRAFSIVRTKDDEWAKINRYAAYTPVATFNTDVFFIKDKFNMDAYEEYVAALQKVADRYGTPNPLKCEKELILSSDFHTVRWADFDFSTNLMLQSIMPTQVNLKAIRPTEAAKAGA